MPDIVHRLVLLAPPGRVFAALTTSQGVRAWWTRDADVGPDKAAFRFPHYGPNAVAHASVQTDEAAGTVDWAFGECFHADWIGTGVHFELTGDNDQTMLAFAHRGFAEQDERFALYNTGWAYYLVSLKRWLETGQGSPAPDYDFVRLFKPAAQVVA